MNINFKDDLLFTSLTLCYKGKIAVIDNVILDTGAARTIISPDPFVFFPIIKFYNQNYRQVQ